MDASIHTALVFVVTAPFDTARHTNNTDQNHGVGAVALTMQSALSASFALCYLSPLHLQHSLRLVYPAKFCGQSSSSLYLMSGKTLTN
jgi:hypothetical protein